MVWLSIPYMGGGGGGGGGRGVGGGGGAGGWRLGSLIDRGSMPCTRGIERWGWNLPEWSTELNIVGGRGVYMLRQGIILRNSLRSA